MSMKELSIPFKMVKIDENQFSMFEDVLSIETEINQSIGFGFGADTKHNTIAVAMQYLLQKDGKPLLKQEITCYFEVKKEAFKKLTKKGEIILPCNFGKHLAMLTTGTARGILYANTKNTAFHKFLMGAINIDTMFKEDIAIEI